MLSERTLSRRQFIAGSTLAAAAAALGAVEPPAAKRRERFKIIGFIKPFQTLPVDEVANVAREVGWTGIECPLRKGGTIEPERVEEDLPKLVDALRRKELE